MKAENHIYFINLDGSRIARGSIQKRSDFIKKSLEIDQKTLPANHPHLATSCNNIGRVYDNMGEYSKALSYYEKDLEISQKTLS